ncbi:putative malate dehydrogenase [Lyophyllum shimeji]|uniref:Malate dehydrogenase n=1 Tax=Lyophyllum shimeji TaxID=47721 RepID=A0A9P3Q342_LYOSH|nr:putative malate dehydrogenase [Lyophyllum shimeji]
MTRDDLFNTNASIVRDLASSIARVSPDAHILVISNPVNSTHLFGVTTLDVVRARRFLAETVGAHPSETPVTVVGGHSGPTIVPLISQSPRGNEVKGEKYHASCTVSSSVVMRSSRPRMGVDFFSSNVELGRDGVEKIHPLGPLSPEEQKLLEACLPELKKNIEKGKNFVQ